MNFLEKNFDQYKNDLKELISFKTFLDYEYPNNEMKNALLFMKKISKRDGLKCVIDNEGYYGYIEIGKGDELIGILTHIDVVPPGENENWKTDPFLLTEKNGKLYGRGTTDDKGPLMMMYYLLKEFKDYSLNKRVRLIFPTDEENHWRGIKKYKENEELPSYGITPDSQFPVTFLEREILQVKLKSKGTNEFIFKGGTAGNVVPEKAYFKSKNNEITVNGKSVHAMKPELGENSITKLVDKLNNLNHPLINFIKNEISNETNGKKLFNKLIKDKYSEITVNLAIAEFNKNESYLIIDSRIPTNSNSDEIISIYESKANKYDYIVEKHKNSKQVYIDENNWLIKDLQDSFVKITGKNIKPIDSSGGTYAKSMKNIVAFGPLMPNARQTQHQFNECIVINDYIKAYDIYVNVIKKWTNNI